MTGEPTHTASKERIVPELMFYLNVYPNYQLLAQPLCFVFSYAQPVTQHYKQRTVGELPLNQTSHHGKYGLSPFTNIGKPLHYCILTPWAVSKKKWDTKEDKGKSVMCALYVPQYAKSTCRAET